MAAILRLMKLASRTNQSWCSRPGQPGMATAWRSPGVAESLSAAHPGCNIKTSCNVSESLGFFCLTHPPRNGATVMPVWTCEQCGAQFPESAGPPLACLICEDERQFVNWKGQTWLTREQLAQHHNLAWRDDLGITGVAIEPKFAIGQRALLVPDGDGCVMWDCVPLATNEAVEY